MKTVFALLIALVMNSGAISYINTNAVGGDSGQKGGAKINANFLELWNDTLYFTNWIRSVGSGCSNYSLSLYNSSISAISQTNSILSTRISNATNSMWLLTLSSDSTSSNYLWSTIIATNNQLVTNLGTASNMVLTTAVAMAYSIGTDSTNYVKAEGALSTNFTLARAGELTNFVKAEGALSTNFTVSRATELTNRVIDEGASSTNFTIARAGELTNYVKAEGALSTNFTVSRATELTNYVKAEGALSTNYSDAIGLAGTNNTIAHTNFDISTHGIAQVTNIIRIVTPTNHTGMAATALTSNIPPAFTPIGLFGYIGQVSTNGLALSGSVDDYTNIFSTLAADKALTNGFHANLSSGFLTNLVAGYYKIQFSVSCWPDVDNNGDEFEAEIFLNEVNQEYIRAYITGSTGVKNRFNGSGTVYLPANTGISLRVKNESDASSVLHIVTASISVGTP